MSHDERRAQIQQAAARRAATAAATPQPNPAPAAPAAPAAPMTPMQQRRAAHARGEAWAQLDGAAPKDAKVGIVAPGTKPTDIGGSGGHQPGQPIVVGQTRAGRGRASTNVQAVGASARGGVQPRTSPGGGNVTMVRRVGTTSSTGVQASVVVPVGAPSAARPAARPGTAAPRETVPAPRADVPEVDLSIVLAYWGRANLVATQIRMLRAQSVRPLGMLLWHNANDKGKFPAQVQGLIDAEPSSSPTIDMGPWIRWAVASQCNTEYVLVIDDDCLPGPRWIELAMERLAKAAEFDVIAAAGAIYNSDRFDDFGVVGPEAGAQLAEETEVDIGRGAWLMRSDVARIIASRRRLGDVEVLSTAHHVASIVQELGGLTIVLPYGPSKDGWGMLQEPKAEGSMSSRIAEEAVAGRSQPPDDIRAFVYDAHREAGWMPLCVAFSEESAAQSDATVEPAGDLDQSATG